MEKTDNELIAEFMGLPESSRIEDHIGKHGVQVLGLGYHRSWDWLMPVVEKIESMGFRITIVKTHCSIDQLSQSGYPDGKPISWGTDDTKISATSQAIINFIHWHSQPQHP